MASLMENVILEVVPSSYYISSMHAPPLAYSTIPCYHTITTMPTLLVIVEVPNEVVACYTYEIITWQVV